jgi:hypothetical protein
MSEVRKCKGVVTLLHGVFADCRIRSSFSSLCLLIWLASSCDKNSSICTFDPSFFRGDPTFSRFALPTKTNVDRPLYNAKYYSICAIGRPSFGEGSRTSLCSYARRRLLVHRCHPTDSRLGRRSDCLRWRNMVCVRADGRARVLCGLPCRAKSFG